MRKLEHIIAEPEDVEAKLREIGLTKDFLISVRDRALFAAADITDDYPANGRGITKYNEAIAGLRDVSKLPENMREKWRKNRDCCIESIENRAVKIRIGYCGVGHACGEKDPQPNNPKGSGSQYACSGNAQESFPDELGLPFPTENLNHFAENKFYYVMIDREGRVELSRPIIEKGKFAKFVERIFITTEDDLYKDVLPKVEPQAPSADDGKAQIFEPEVMRK